MAELVAGYSKVCIGQTSTTDDLRCLPVFLAGCNSILVTTGYTCPTRLWCAVELFVYFAFRGLATSVLRDALRSNGEAELVDPIVIGAGIMEEDLRLGVVLHQWSERDWERVASAQAAL